MQAAIRRQMHCHAAGSGEARHENEAPKMMMLMPAKLALARAILAAMRCPQARRASHEEGRIDAAPSAKAATTIPSKLPGALLPGDVSAPRRKEAM